MFVKYPSLENHYQEKQINKMIKKNPDIDKQEFVITEKLDGTNIQLIFEPNQEMKVGSRNQVTSFEFFNVGKAIEEPHFKNFFKNVQQFCNDYDCSINIYGELFGQGIQKRIDYGKPKLRFFDMRINEILLSFELFKFYINQFSQGEDYNLYATPIISFVTGFDKALDFDVENLKSFYNPNEIAEGVVIKPAYSKIEGKKRGEFLIIKKKSEKFKEFMKRGPNKEKLKWSKEIEEWKKTFEQYINRNRVLSLISKEGPIDSKEKIGKYIGLIIQDAREDFLKDHEMPEFEKNELKQIFNCGSLVHKHLNEFIEI